MAVDPAEQAAFIDGLRMLFSHDDDHLEKLGTETVPGRVLEMLREKTVRTHGYVGDGQKSLNFRLWGIAGLNAREVNGDLDARSVQLSRTCKAREFQ